MYSLRHKTSKRTHSVCVGIITIPHMKQTKYGTSHIMKPYVDWFEDRGVRVIPIPFDTTEYDYYFGIVNGLFVPGGETPFILKSKAFIRTVTRFVEMSFQQDEYFPIWGTCFGFQMLISLIGGITRFKEYPSHGLYPIHITEAGYNSRLFGSFSARYLEYLQNNKSSSNNHEYGISSGDFMNNPHLRRFYDIIATAVDERGKEYVTAIEGKYYPIYGVQWHPERQKSTGAFVDFFISELKKNKHKCGGYKFLRSSMPSYKCVQYPEHKNILCYFFN